jgi:nucleoside-diphosphate-sugar epimerase
MKTALIIGINGNFGFQMALALRAKGWAIHALMRDPAKAPSWLDSAAIVKGQAQDEAVVLNAAKDADLLVYAANPPYQHWPRDAMAMLEPTVKAAEQLHLPLLFPGNVYSFAPQSEPIDELVTMDPPTDKGLIRQRMEQRLKQASQNGARVLIVRAGDFIGPNTAMTWLDLMATVKGKTVKLKLPHDDSHVHYYSYLPDLCANTARLLDEPLGDWEVFHDSGLALGKADWEKACRGLGLRLQTSAFPWWGLNMAAWFSPLLTEVKKMRYLWRKPVVMNGDKWMQRLGSAYQSTTLAAVIQNTLLKSPR